MRARLFTAVLAALAALNVGAGVVLGVRRPFRAIDLITVWDWCRAWLFYGQDLYRIPGSLTNYPPHGIVWLAPIALLPAAWILPVWTLLSLALTLILPLAIARATNADAPVARIATATLLFLCWACVRNGLQFSQLSMLLAFAAVLLADSRPVASGIALALALVKLHIAGPIAIGLVATRRVRPVVIAAMIVAGGVAVYAWHAGSPIWTVVESYMGVLGRMYTGPDAQYGRTNIQPWIVAGAGAQSGDAVWLAVVVSLLLFVCALAFVNRGEDSPVRVPTVRALFCVWALVSAFQLAHNFVLFLPAFMALVLVEHPPTRLERYIAAGVLTTALTIDLPVRLSPFLTPGPLLALVDNLDRLLAVGVFVYLTILWVRLGPAGEPAHITSPAQWST